MRRKYKTGTNEEVLSWIEYGCVDGKLLYVTYESIIKEIQRFKETDKDAEERLSRALYYLKMKGCIKDKGFKKYAFVKRKSKHEIYYAHCSHVTKKNNRPYCPIKKHYIQPDEQCIAVDDLDGTKKISIPKCKGYATNNKSTKISTQRLQDVEAEDIGTYRFYNGRQHDPESKHYLPRLMVV